MTRAGCYGLAIEGLEGARELFGPVGADAQVVRVEVRQTQDAPRVTAVEPDRAVLALQHGGAFTLDRAAGTVLLEHPEALTDHDVVHPYLAPAASWWNQWLGRDCLHAGAFVLDGGAVVVLAGREGGKSTTLAYLALQHGLDVLADDLVVLDGADVLAGPRSVDLRQPPPHDAPAVIVRGASRHRVVLSPGAARLPLRAVVVLRWAESERVERVAVPARPAFLAASRMDGPRSRLSPAVLGWSAVPMLVVARPQVAAGIEQTCGRLLGALSRQ